MDRGASVSSLYKFCTANNIHRFEYGRMTNGNITRTVQDAVSRVGPTYGRKMMTGYVRSNGYRIGERTIGRVLKQATPFYCTQRRHGMERQTNPCPYFAEYAGHKLHLDQNEKLCAFGATHVLAIDGYSSKIVGWCTMPMKNNCRIYDDVYRKTCLQFGLFEQIRVDYGKEFYLVLYQQEKLAGMRNNNSRPPYIQTTSKLNHKVERLWVEVNARVNYPIKYALQELVNDDLLDMEDEITKFCISDIAIGLCNIGMINVVNAWNSHTIPGKGVPNVLYNDTCKTTAFHSDAMPPSSVVALNYRTEGGTINEMGSFGIDPLKDDQNLLIRRQDLFAQVCPDFAAVFDCTVNRNSQPLKHAALTLIHITRNLSAFL